MKFEDLTRKQIQALAETHILQFDNKIKAGKHGAKFVNVHECEWYLHLWTRVLEKTQVEKEDEEVRASIAEEERNEIVDALVDGGYDAVLLSVAPS